MKDKIRVRGGDFYGTLSGMQNCARFDVDDGFPIGHPEHRVFFRPFNFTDWMLLEELASHLEVKV